MLHERLLRLDDLEMINLIAAECDGVEQYITFIAFINIPLHCLSDRRRHISSNLTALSG